MKAALVFIACMTACCAAGDSKPERLKLVSTIPVMNAYGRGGILVSASLVRDVETGREWLIVSSTASASAIVTEIQK